MGAQSGPSGLAELARRDTPSAKRINQPPRNTCFSDGNALKQVSSIRQWSEVPIPGTHKPEVSLTRCGACPLLPYERERIQPNMPIEGEQGRRTLWPA